MLKVLDVAQGGQLYAEASPSLKRLIGHSICQNDTRPKWHGLMSNDTTSQNNTLFAKMTLGQNDITKLTRPKWHNQNDTLLALSPVNQYFKQAWLL